MNSISIIICFYNAENKLQKTLEHIKKIDTSNVGEVELILVNNNSNDNSLAIINQELMDFKIFPWKVVEEKNPGLANARMKGFDTSQHDFLLICDDDNWLAEDYLTMGLQPFLDDDKIAVVGGCGAAVSDVDIPSWFEEYQSYYAVGPQWHETGEVKIKRNMVYGAGMIVRKSAFLLILKNGFKFFALGRTGKSLSSGEDSELCLAFRIAGFKIWYNEDLCFKHFIESNRLSTNYLEKLLKGINSGNYISRFYREYLFGYRPKVGSLFWLKEAFYVLKNSKKAFFSLNLKEYKRCNKHLIYIIIERSKYDRSIKEIYNICNNLKAINGKLL